MSTATSTDHERRRLGRTALWVSPIGFGGASLGIKGYLSDEDRTSATFREEAIGAIHLALDGGINLVDTAPGYGNGRSEAIVGDALVGRREEVVLTTKCSIDTAGTPERWQANLEASLRRLRTDRVDVLQFHGATYTDELLGRMLSCGIVDWAEEQKRLGLTRFIGITAENSSASLETLIRSERFDVLQIAFNLINQGHCDYSRADQGMLTGIVPLARSLDMGILTMRTTTSGFLQALLPLEFPGVTPAAAARLAIRFALSVPEVHCALVGMTCRNVVRNNLRLMHDPTQRLDPTRLHQRFPKGRQPESG